MVDVLVVEFMILFAVIVVAAMGTVGVVAVADMDHGHGHVHHGWFAILKNTSLKIK